MERIREAIRTALDATNKVVSRLFPTVVANRAAIDQLVQKDLRAATGAHQAAHAKLRTTIRRALGDCETDDDAAALRGRRIGSM